MSSCNDGVSCVSTLTNLAYLVVVSLGQDRVLEELVRGEGEEQLEAGLLGVQILELDVGQMLESLHRGISNR